jgi:hypothetical protein
MVDVTGNIIKTLKPSLTSEFTALSCTSNGFLLAVNKLSSNVSVRTSLEYYLDDLTLKDSITLDKSPFYISDMVQDNGSIYLTGVQGPVSIGLPRVDKYSFNSNVYSTFWSTGDTTTSIIVTPTQSTKYFVTFSDGITSYQDSITVNIAESLDFNPLSDTLMVCADSLFLDAGADFDTYKWSNDSTSQRIPVSVSGFYKITVNDLNGCNLIDSTYIEFSSNIILQQDTTISLGDSLELSYNVGQFRTSNALFNPGSPNPWNFPGPLNGGYIPLGTFGPQNKFSVSMWVKPETVQTSGIGILVHMVEVPTGFFKH